MLCIESFVLNRNSVETKIDKQVLLFSFLKKSGLKNKKQYLFDIRANKNEAINILGFSLY